MMRFIIILAILTLTVIPALAQSPPPKIMLTAETCPNIHQQVRTETDRRFDAAGYDAKMLTLDGEKLCADGKLLEASHKYQDAAKVVNIELIAPEPKK